MTRLICVPYGSIGLARYPLDLLMLYPQVIVILVTLTTLPGCAGWGTSRWAMDDSVYSEKYSIPYPSNDARKIRRLLKQSIDARHVADRGGTYFGGGGADEPTSGGIEVGAFRYAGTAIETRGGLKGLIGTGARDWFAGVDLGIRTQAPSRIAPFAGVGTYVGGNSQHFRADNDGVDNNGDGRVDEFREQRRVSKFLASVYPELGIHFWLNSTTRLTASAQYHLTTEGRDQDFWFVGGSISFLETADSAEFEKPEPPAETIAMDLDRLIPPKADIAASSRDVNMDSTADTSGN